MVDTDEIKDATSEDTLSDKFKEKARGAAGAVKEKAKEGAGKAKEKVKGKVKEKLEERERKKKQKEAEERAYQESKREARIKEASNVGRAEGISEAREQARVGYGGSKIGRAIKGVASRVSMMGEDTGGAFGSEERKMASFVDTRGIQDSLTGTTMDPDKLDVAPSTNLRSPANRKMDLLGKGKEKEIDLLGKSKKSKKGDFGFDRNPDDFFGSSKTDDLLNFGKKKKKKDFDFY